MANVQTAQREQTRASQLAAARTQTKRNGMSLAFNAPWKLVRGAMLAASLGGGAVSSEEQYQMGSAQRLADHRAQQLPEELNVLVEQGLISEQVIEQIRAQKAAIQAQAVAAQTTAQVAIAMQRNRALQEQITASTEKSKLVDTTQEFREQWWRALRIGGPATDDATGGISFGLGTAISYVIWIVQALKGIRYRNEPEPLTLTAILSPPPMPLSIAKKDMAKVGKIFIVTLLDVMGFMWNNINLALVVVLLTLMVILIAGINCTLSPISFVTSSDFCQTFVSFFSSVALD